MRFLRVHGPAILMFVPAFAGIASAQAPDGPAAVPPTVPAPAEEDLGDAIYDAFANASSYLTDGHLDAAIRQALLDFGAILAISIGVALVLGMVLGSVLSALILRGAIKRIARGQ